MKRDLTVKSTVIDWLDKTLEVTDTGKFKYILPLTKSIHVTMVGYPNREEKTIAARDLAPYMERGYIIERVDFEDDEVIKVCPFCSAKFANEDTYQIHLGIGAPAFHNCNDAKEMKEKGMSANAKGVWNIASSVVMHANEWAYLDTKQIDRFIEAVKQEAASYWSGGDEPVQIVRVWLDGVDSAGNAEFKVEWISESTKDELRDDMIYTVSVDGDELDVFGPEW